MFVQDGQTQASQDIKSTLFLTGKLMVLIIRLGVLYAGKVTAMFRVLYLLQDEAPGPVLPYLSCLIDCAM